jgi:predicted nucleic acid-binding protein
VTVPLIDELGLELRNHLTLLTRALVSNDSELTVHHQLYKNSPDVSISNPLNSNVDNAWIYTRPITTSNKKALHKAKRVISVGQTNDHMEQVSLCETLKQNIIHLDPRLHWSIVVDDQEISITDGIHFVEGQILGIEHLFNITETQPRWA